MGFLTNLVNRNSIKWLYLGLGVKRWLVLLFVGVMVLALGLAYVLLIIYREPSVHDALYDLKQFVDDPVRALLFGALGFALTALAVVRLSRSLLSAFVTDDISVVEALYRKRALRRGPKIVALGGGTGLSTLLRGLKEHTDKLTAIVTVADDGGSSGRLRRELGVLPPGDFRQCIAALADSEPLMTQLFQYRFGEGAGLSGHSFGNLFIAALAGITGSFERALLESSRVLAVRGRILPSTLQNVTLCADTRNPEPARDNLERVAGESEITHRGRPIERVYLEPEHAPAYPGVVSEILDADLIIAGPGSLYTSVLPNLLVEDVQRALQVSGAPKIYICNIATQPGETDNFTVEDHLDALVQHVGSGIFTHVIANNNWRVNLPEHSRSRMVRLRDNAPRDFHLILADVANEAQSWRHDPQKLANEILKWYNNNTQYGIRNM